VTCGYNENGGFTLFGFVIFSKVEFDMEKFKLGDLVKYIVCPEELDNWDGEMCGVIGLIADEKIFNYGFEHFTRFHQYNKDYYFVYVADRGKIMWDVKCTMPVNAEKN
jgi:hypothetical protein